MNVFASVGTQKFPFNRLLKIVDEVAAKSAPGDRFFAQTGFSDCSVRFNSKPFLQKEEFEQHIRDCDLLIVHGGVGTIITALKLGKKIIVIPRLEKYHEHVDDHQMQIAESFAENKLVLCYHDNDDIFALIRQSSDFSFAPYVSHRVDMIATIENYLAGLQSPAGVSSAM